VLITAGVGLSGTLPDRVTINKHLSDLALSHNALTGSIPGAFQSRPWRNFDVSYNKLEGTLSGSFGADEHGNSSLSLENNRLSGIIPGPLQRLLRISLLGSNLFSCEADGSDLPRHDSEAGTYNCGSDSFESTYYVWIALLGSCLALGVLAWRRQEWVAGAVTLATHWRKWLNASKGIVDKQTKVTAQYKTVALVNQVIRILCRTALWCTLYMVFFLLPFYCVVSVFYGTYTHEYAYTASAAFLGGRLPMALESVLFLGLMLIVLRFFLRHLIAFTAKEREVRRSASLTRSPSNTSASSGSTQRQATTLARNLTVYAAFATANVVMVVGANLAFVYVAIYQSKDLLVIAEVAVAVFKIVWSEFGSSYLLRWASSLVVYEVRADRKRKDAENTRLIMIQVFVALLNNVAIPCLVVAFVSNSCFYGVFTGAPTTSTPYAYQLCIEVVRGECITNSINFGYSEYSPPFTYSFLCSSSFVAYYAPVFVTLCVIKTFVVPFSQMMLLYAHTKCAPGSTLHRFADAVLFAILKPVSDDGRRYREYYKVNRLLVELTNIFGLLLTFGAVFPPLGVALMVTMFAVTYFSRLCLGRCICSALELGHAEYVEIIEQEGQRAGAVEVLWQSAWMLITFACCFYTLFLFDTLGDAIGGQRALWVLFVVPSVPLWLYLCFITYNKAGPFLRRAVGLPSPAPTAEASGEDTIGEAERDMELMVTSTTERAIRNPMNLSSRQLPAAPGEQDSAQRVVGGVSEGAGAEPAVTTYHVMLNEI
jgi:hypothetical protein